MRKGLRSGGLGLVVLLGAVTLLAGGCGGKKKAPALSKAAYNKQMTIVGRSLSGTNAKDAATALTTVQTELRAGVDTLKKITAPADVKDAHEQLITAIGDFANDLDPIVKKLKNGNFAARLEVTSLKSFAAIQTAAAAIAKAGYSIG
jgi:hypothetical protein